MGETNKYLSILAVVFYFTINIVVAQSPARYISFGPSLASYKGDLSNYEKFSAGLEISLIQNKGKRIQGILNLSAGSVVAQSVEPVYQGLEYNPLNFVKSSFFTVNYTLNYYIIQKENFKTYAGIGIGFFQFKPKNQYGDEVFSVSNDARKQSEKYALTKPCLPIQFGAIYTLKNNFGFQANVKWLNTRTDYLDNMSQLGNPNTKDNILLINIGFVIPMKEPKPTDETPVL